MPSAPQSPPSSDRADAAKLLETLEESELGVLPLRNQIVFPAMRGGIELRRARSVALARSLDPAKQRLVVLVVQRDPRTENYPTAAELPPVGVVARVIEKSEPSPGSCGLIVEGLERVRLTRVVRETPFLTVCAERIRATPSPDTAIGALHAALRARALKSLPEMTAEIRAALESSDDPARTSDCVAASVVASIDERTALLETLDVAERLRMLDRLVAREEARQQGIRDTIQRMARAPRDLWPMEREREARLASAVASGAMTAEEAARVRDFAEKGYVIWEGLIPPQKVDAFVADLDSIGQHPGCFLATDHKRSQPFQYTGPDFDRFESVFDTYVNFERARQLCFHPTILRFLELIFDARPIATQQLLFQRSNGHEAHQDTAFVCMEEPLHLVATWIALEDVVRGRGELTYFEGSHRLPARRFADGSRRFTPGQDDPAAMRNDLVEQCRERGCPKRDFIARKGDVFLWAADLVHASNPRTRPLEETRLSCVTHYCPETTRPLWFYLYPENQVLQPYNERAFIASSHYRLPVKSAFAPPHFRLALPA